MNKENIVFIGTFRGASGYANASRGYVKSWLKDDRFNLQLIDTYHSQDKSGEDMLRELEVTKLEEIPDNYTVVYFVEGGDHYLKNINHLDVSQVIGGAKKKIAMAVWEPNDIPEEWAQFYNDRFDALLVASEWNKEVFSKRLKIPIHVLPYYVEANYVASPKPKIFNVASVSQFIPRKGFKELVYAFLAEFKDNEDARLTIKTYFNLAQSVDQDRYYVTNELKNYKTAITGGDRNPVKCQLALVHGVIPREAMDNLYDDAAFVATATRGEGFGLPLAECILRGKRTISPNLGGHLDFINEDNLHFESKLQTLTAVYLSRNYNSDMKWIEPDLDDLRKALRSAYDEWKSCTEDEWAKKNLASYEYAKEYLSSKAINEKFYQILGK